MGNLARKIRGPTGTDRLFRNYQSILRSRSGYAEPVVGQQVLLTIAALCLLKWETT